LILSERVGSPVTGERKIEEGHVQWLLRRTFYHTLQRKSEPVRTVPNVCASAAGASCSAATSAVILIVKLAQIQVVRKHAIGHYCKGEHLGARFQVAAKSVLRRGERDVRVQPTIHGITVHDDEVVTIYATAPRTPNPSAAGAS